MKTAAQTIPISPDNFFLPEFYRPAGTIRSFLTVTGAKVYTYLPESLDYNGLKNAEDARHRLTLNTVKENNALPGDSEIIRQIREENRIDRYRILMDRYQNQVRSIVCRQGAPEEAEHLIQEVFIRAFRSLTTFRGRSTFRTWLTRIAIRTCADYWRSQYRSREYSLTRLTENQREWLEKTGSARSEEDFRKNIERREGKEVLESAIDRLHPDERTVLQLIYLEEMSGREAARALDCSVTNVRVKAFRARKKIRRYILNLLRGTDDHEK